MGCQQGIAGNEAVSWGLGDEKMSGNMGRRHYLPIFPFGFGQEAFRLRSSLLGSLGAWIPKIVEISILRAADEVGNAIAIEIYDGRAHVMTLDVLGGDETGVLEEPVAVRRGTAFPPP